MRKVGTGVCRFVPVFTEYAYIMESPHTCYVTCWKLFRKKYFCSGQRSMRLQSCCLVHAIFTLNKDVYTWNELQILEIYPGRAPYLQV